MNKYLTLAAALCAAAQVYAARVAPALAQSGDYGGGYTGGGPSLPRYTAPSYAPPVPLYTQPMTDPETARRIEELQQQNRLLMLEYQRQVFEKALRGY